MNIYIISSLFLIIIDILWVHVVMNNKYKKMIPYIQNGEPMKVSTGYVLLAYLFLLLGLNLLVIPQMHKTWWFPFVFGLVVYGVFSFTNASIFNKWSFTVILLDTLWGGLLFLMSTFFGKLLCNYFFKS